MLCRIEVKLLATLVCFCSEASAAFEPLRRIQLAYLCCFGDAFGAGVTRDLPELKNYGLTRIRNVGVTNHPDAVSSPHMSHEVCAAVCSMMGARYFGLQAEGWCFCGDNYGSHGVAAESQCHKTCSGNAAQKCGGDFSNSVFQINYLNKNIFNLGDRTLVDAQPAFKTKSSVRSRVGCAGLCNRESTCQAVLYLKQQGLCHLLEYPALPSSLASETGGEFFVRG